MGMFRGDAGQNNMVGFGMACHNVNKVLTGIDSNKVKVIERGKSESINLSEDVPEAILP